jgi:hypothetical protein
VKRERGRCFEPPGNVGRPGDGASSDSPERTARAHDGRRSCAFRRQQPVTAWPRHDMPPHQQAEQALLGGTGQKLIDEGLTVAQGEQRATRQKLGLEAARRLEPDQAEPRVVSDRDADGLVTSVQRTFLAVR